MQIKLLINLNPLRKPLTGIGYYTKNVIAELLKRDVILVGLQNGHLFEKSDIEQLLSSFESKSQNEDSVQFTLKKTLINIVRSVPGIYSIKHLLVNFRAKKYLRQLASEGYVYFEPSFVPMPFDGQVVTTVHDLSFITYPEFHPKERVTFLTKKVKSAVTVSTHVMVDSDYIRDELLQNYEKAEGAVSTVYLGADDSFQPYSVFDCSQILSHFEIKYKGFILSVATLEPRKNLPRLVSAYRALPDKLKELYPLVLVGDPGWKNNELFEQNQDLLKSKQLIITGYVADDDLKRLYASAKLFAYPSLYEGFGLPVLEAMASGAVVMTSNIGATAEVAGNSALLIAPDSIKSMRDGMSSILTDDQLIASLESSSIERAKLFSWKKCVDDILTIVQHL
ncbi:glycosyltransferase family 4 protein [Psychromonas aquimarina]|uniref:glycosyltransferase family 4 protein n=1 Tax=Psychromonas aquimarina TaxID=444919 RepID=UPI0004027657|nr:glycosyltransferase family 1 protein [Psychromonas aquimarina]